MGAVLGIWVHCKAQELSAGPNTLCGTGIPRTSIHVLKVH
jgi:hypothetical protein